MLRDIEALRFNINKDLGSQHVHHNMSTFYQRL